MEQELVGWSAEDQLFGKRLLDLAEAVTVHNDYRLTDFLDPHQQDLALGLIKKLGLGWVGFGGYRQAERKRLALMPTYYTPEMVDPAIVAIAISGGPNLVALGHRDYCGALLSLGLKREKLGDILITENGAQVLVVKEIAEYICTHLQQVHKYPVTASEIDLEALAVPAERIKKIRTTVASLRLDAVASSGYGVSRTKMVREIKAERVKVNWQQVDNPARNIQEGDVISIRGRGRLVVKEVQGTSKKGRIVLLLERLY